MIDLLCGDAKAVLDTLPERSVQCCVTSPPYFNLRSYGVYGQIGLETTPEAYIARLVGVFRAVHRVLRDDGTLWLNIGDSFSHLNQRKEVKNLLGIPWMLAFALRADGWYWRAWMPWIKRCVLPEPTKDRPTFAHEVIHLFAKSERYFFDMDAVRRAPAAKSLDRYEYGLSLQRDPNAIRGSRQDRVHAGVGQSAALGDRMHSGGRNFRTTDPFFDSLRSILDGGEELLADGDDPLALVVNPRPFKAAHFATFAPQLVEPLIKAGTSERGQCAACGKPWARMVTAGWKPGCACNAGDPVPQTVLDPFGGAGTTALVARKLGRSAVSIDLNPAYVELARQRLACGEPPAPAQPAPSAEPAAGEAVPEARQRTLFDFLAAMRAS